MQSFQRLLCRGEFTTQPYIQDGVLEKIVKRFKDVIYFCNKLHLKCLTGIEYTSEEYLCWKYPENQIMIILFAKLRAVGLKTLISLKQGSTREKIWMKTFLQKSFFKITEKEKHSWMFSTYWKGMPPLTVFCKHTNKNIFMVNPKLTYV